MRPWPPGSGHRCPRVAPSPASLWEWVSAPPAASSGRRPLRLADLFGERDQLVEYLDVPLAHLDLGEATVIGERPVGMADRQIHLDQAGTARGEHLPQLGLRPDRAEHSGARADHGD